MARTLLVDIGNSAIKWAWTGHRERLSSPGYLTHFGNFSPSLWERVWADTNVPEAVWFASVAAPEASTRLVEWVGQRWNVLARRVYSERAALGVVNGYRDAALLGVDRWLALLAARGRHDGPLCVADCGTAVTIDALDERGRHLGGFVLPGLALGRRALLEHTTIPPVEDVELCNGFGRDTATAVAMGGRRAIAGVIDFTMAELRPARSGPALFLTGSEAGKVLPLLSQDCIEVPHLVLEGLARYARSS